MTCLAVLGHAAQIKGTVTEVTGFYSTFVSVGNVIESDVIDNGPPSGGIPDQIDNAVLPPGSDATCSAAGVAPFFPVENGNITVHDR